MRMFSKDACDLLVLCVERAQEIYGEDLPLRINNRIIDEIMMLNYVRLERDFLWMAHLLDETVPDPADRINIGVRDGAGAYLVSYLCGLSPYNPAEYLDGRFCPELYPDTIVRRANAGQSPRLTLNVGAGIDEKMKAKIKCLPKHTTVRVTQNLTLLEKLQKSTGKLFFPSDKCGENRKATISVSRSTEGSDHPGDCSTGTECFWKYVPLLRDNRIIMALSEVVDINNIWDLSKAIGVAMGTGTWIDNVETMVREADRCGKAFDIGRPGIISCVEDVYDYLGGQAVWMIEDGVPLTGEQCKALKFRIAYQARTGSCSEDNLKALAFFGKSEFKQSLLKVRYLMDRPACVAAAIEVKRLAYYWNEASETYLKCFDEVTPSTTAGAARRLRQAPESPAVVTPRRG